MKLLSWNVNGLRAIMKKGFTNSVERLDPDIIALQEIKMMENQLPQIKDFNFNKYHIYWNSAERPGYSGTLVMTKTKPNKVINGIKGDYTDEGRVITLEYNDFYLVNTYTPNSKRGLERLSYRMKFEDAFREYLLELDKDKPVVLCGDLNVAHQEMDLKNPKTNTKNPGFTLEERNKYTTLLDSGFTDTFRKLYPTKVQYTWWSYMFNARKNNAGWRIDYFVVSDRLLKNVTDSVIHDEIVGSDHCPVLLDIKNIN